MVYYHITKRQNKESIMAIGIKANRGKVFLFDNVSIPYCEGLYRWDKWTTNMRDIPVVDIIAKNELLLKEYSMFRVETTVDAEDNQCGESMVMKHQHIHFGDISKENITYVGDFSVKSFWDCPLLEGKLDMTGKAVRHLKKKVNGKTVSMGFIVTDK